MNEISLRVRRVAVGLAAAALSFGAIGSAVATTVQASGHTAGTTTSAASHTWGG